MFSVYCLIGRCSSRIEMTGRIVSKNNGRRKDKNLLWPSPSARVIIFSELEAVPGMALSEDAPVAGCEVMAAKSKCVVDGQDKNYSQDRTLQRDIEARECPRLKKYFDCVPPSGIGRIAASILVKGINPLFFNPPPPKKKIWEGKKGGWVLRTSSMFEGKYFRISRPTTKVARYPIIK
jgi:hypothetical protein